MAVHAVTKNVSISDKLDMFMTYSKISLMIHVWRCDGENVDRILEWYTLVEILVLWEG